LLDEAIASVGAQDHADWEIVLVDDGSQPPIDTAPLAARLGAQSMCLRHEQACAIASAKNAGIAAASGEVILILDDDDLLAPGALAEICAAFAAQPALDCLFMGVEPFGPHAATAARNRQVAVAKVVAVATQQDDAGRYHFDHRGDGLAGSRALGDCWWIISAANVTWSASALRYRRCDFRTITSTRRTDCGAHAGRKAPGRCWSRFGAGPG